MHMQLTENSSAWKTPIEVIPMQQYYEDEGKPELYKDKNVIVSQDKSRLFSVVNSKKKVLEHENAVELFYKGIESAFDATPSVDVISIRKGAGIRALFSFPGEAEIDIGNDVIFLRGYLFNSYDASLGTRWKMGGFRTACDNSMVIGGREFMLNSREISSLDDPEALGTRLKNLYNRTHTIAGLWKIWKQLNVDYITAHEALYEEVPATYRQNVLNPDEFPKTVWSLYNDLTQIATHKTRTDSAKLSLDARIERLFYSKNSPFMPLYKDSFDEVRVEAEAIELA